MKQALVFIFIIVGLQLKACLTDSSKLKHREVSPPTEMNDKPCAHIDAVEIIIEEAIAIGAPTYNDGNHTGCYRIYEGAAYKILYKYGAKCKEIKSALEAALEKAYGDYTATEKAWIMRMAFDKILGVPTTTK